MNSRSPIGSLALVIVLCGTASGGIVTAEDENEIHTCIDEQGAVVFQNDPCPEPVEPPPPVPPVAVTPSVPHALEQPRITGTIELRAGDTSWTIPAGKPLGGPRVFRKQTFPTRLIAVPSPVEPNFASPADTWHTFLAAVEEGDRAGAASCFTAAAAAEMGGSVEQFPVEALRGLLRSFDRIENDGDLGPYWSIYGIRDGGRPRWIFFEETTAGEWKISGI